MVTKKLHPDARRALVVIFLLGILPLAFLLVNHQDPNTLKVIVIYSVFLIPAVGFYLRGKIIDKPEEKGLAFTGIDENWVKDSLTGAVAGIFFILLSLAVKGFTIGTPQASALANLTAIELFVTIVLVAPTSEEPVFRGYLNHIIGKHVFNKKTKEFSMVLAIVVSGIFSFFHLNAYGVGLESAFIAAGAFGLFAAWLTTKTNSIITPIIAHMMFNFFVWGQATNFF